MEFLELKIFGNTILDYLISLGIFILVLAVWVVVYHLVRKQVQAFVERTQTQVDDLFLERLYSPLTYVGLIIGLALATDHLKFPPPIRFWTERVFLVLGLVVFFLIVSRVIILAIDLTAEGYARRLRDREPDDLESQILGVERLRRQAREIARMLVVALACLTVLSNVGINLRAVWASLGIGGIALALAVQEPLRNLIGRGYIFLTGIFDEGHFISFNKWSGTVRKISAFRTYIELFSDMTTVSIPNADFIKGVVKNYYGRTKFMYKWDLDVPYNIEAEDITKLVADLRALILEKPEVNADMCWVYLERLDAHSKVVRVWFQAQLSGWSDSLFYGNLVLHDIQILFESLGIPFAFPTQTLMLETEKPLRIREEGERSTVILPDPEDSTARH